MSYGRQPYYIFKNHGGDFTIWMGNGAPSTIPYDALAQLIVSMQWRQNGEFEALVARGLELRPELASCLNPSAKSKESFQGVNPSQPSPP